MRNHAKFKVIKKELPVIICSRCSKVIKEWRYFTEDEKLAFKGEFKLDSQYCDECEEKLGIYK